MNPRELRKKILRITELTENIDRKIIKEKIVEIKKTTKNFLEEKKKKIKSNVDPREIRGFLRKIEKFAKKIKES